MYSFFIHKKGRKFMKKILALICALLIGLNMFCLPAVAAEKTPLETVKELVSSLPSSYVTGLGDTINTITEIMQENGIKTKDLGSTLSIKYATFLNSYNSFKKRTNSQDRININWQEKNPLTCVDMFEDASVVDVAEIANKPGIAMSPKNNAHFPATVPYGRFIGFYETSSVKKNFSSTFPDTYGEYYITPENDFQYSYSGISKNPGEITYNAGIVSPLNSYEITFDRSTKYNQVSFLMSGITFLSGEWARSLQLAKTVIHFADGTSKEQFHIVGPFCYGYRMALYSTLADKETMYSEFLGSVGLAKDFDKLWVPNEANIDSYFKVGNGRVVIPQKADDGTITRNIKTFTDVGNASAITIETDGKAIDRVSVS